MTAPEWRHIDLAELDDRNQFISSSSPKRPRSSISPADYAPTVSAMSVEPPFAHLPDEITTRDELAVVLFALDVVEEADVDPADSAKVTRAIRLLTAKLWPELGDLLGEDEE